MTHTDLILICTIVGFSGCAALGLVIKGINKLTIPPQNILTRRGDIELADYTPPTQPLNVYFPNEIAVQTSNNLPIEVEIQTSHDLSREIAIQTSNTISSINYQSIPPYFNEFIYSPLENENFYSNLLENNFVFYGLGTIAIGLITGFLIKSYFFTTPKSPPTFNLTLDQLKEIETEDNNLTLEQLSEIINKLNRGEELDEEIRNKLDLEFKLLVDDITNSGDNHPLKDQPVYINSYLENKINSEIIILTTLFIIILFIIISLFVLKPKLKFLIKTTRISYIDLVLI